VIASLVARLQALLRRSKSGNAKPPDDRVVVGPIRIDPDRRIAEAGSTRLDLSRREFDLLLTLCRNPEIVLSRVRLLELVWGYDFEVDTNVVDVFVGYLRRKLALAGVDAAIATVRGVGFVLRAGP
jgi:DNA-binding response OmpR family regulator